jgi:hypothetical protein
MLTASSVYSFGLDDLAREAGGALKEVTDKVEEVSDEVKAVNEIVNPSPTQESSTGGKPSARKIKSKVVPAASKADKQGANAEPQATLLNKNRTNDLIRVVTNTIVKNKWTLLESYREFKPKCTQSAREHASSFSLKQDRENEKTKFESKCLDSLKNAITLLISRRVDFEDYRKSYKEFCVESESDKKLFNRIFHFYDKHGANLNFKNARNVSYAREISLRFAAVGGWINELRLTPNDIKQANKWIKTVAVRGWSASFYNDFTCPDDIERLYQEGCRPVVPLCKIVRAHIMGDYVVSLENYLEKHSGETPLLKAIIKQKVESTKEENRHISDKKSPKMDGKQSSQEN